MEKIANKTDLIREESVKILQDYLGLETAKMYGDFYRDKPKEIVLESISELLSELVGTKKAQSIIANQITKQL